MRIGLVSHEYPPQQGLGGVGTYTFRLAGALGKAGNEVHVITGPSDQPPVQQANVTVHRIPADYEPPEWNKAMRWVYWQCLASPMNRVNPLIWHWLRWNLSSYDAIKRIDAAHPFDLVEAPEHAANGWMAGQIHRWPLTLRVHCPWELFVRINKLPFNPMNRLMACLERRTVSHYADTITVPSQAMKREIERSWKLRRPVHVIPNFMDVPPEPAPLPSDGPQRIICTGRIEPLKGQDTLAKAFALIARRHPRAELWIVGPDRWRCQSSGAGQFAELLTKIVPEPDIRARIHQPGLVPLHQMAGHIRRARVAVVCSIGFESFSYSTLEAMAAARPTIVTRTGALPELIDHEKTGLVVTPDDPHELASSLERMLEDEPFARACGLAAHAKAVDRYDTQSVLPTMMEAYEHASMFFYRDHIARPAPVNHATLVGLRAIPA